MAKRCGYLAARDEKTTAPESLALGGADLGGGAAGRLLVAELVCEAELELKRLAGSRAERPA